MAHDLKIFTDNIGPNALNQVYELAVQPAFAHQKIRIMPDVHFGKGCVVGFTSTMGNGVIPNVIGVDIGCGMLTVELGKIDIDYHSLDSFIRANIPSGTKCRKEENGVDLVQKLRCFSQLTNLPRIYGSLGTLGGGNHFIEIDADTQGNKFLVVHSGSRNLGLQVANLYQHKAIDQCKNCAEMECQQVIEQLKAQNRQDEIPQAIDEVVKKYAFRTKIPNQLCYLDGAEMQKYLHDVKICQQFASQNRQKIAKEILKHLGVHKYSSFETVHNFIDEDNVIRKGAIPARKGQRVLIPMNMRDGCLVCVGKGNDDWNFSAPHGAGRLLARGDCKELISLEEYQQSMQGIFTTSVSKSTIDESPMAYKPMQEIVSLIQPTVEIEKIIKPTYNFKAGE